MAITVSAGAQILVDILNNRFGREYGKFSIEPGKRYDKIVVTPNHSNQRHVHAFVECATGYVLKPNGWKTPAKGVRYTDARTAGLLADPYGRYLYAR